MHRLLAAEFGRTFRCFRRYPSEALVGVLTLGVMFGLFLLGVQYVSGPVASFGSRLDSIIVGYVLWSLTLMTLSDAGYGIQMEAQMGTLEQVYQSPFGPIRILLARAVASIGLYLILNVLVLAVLLLLTGSVVGARGDFEVMVLKDAADRLGLSSCLELTPFTEPTLAQRDKTAGSRDGNVLFTKPEYRRSARRRWLLCVGA